MTRNEQVAPFEMGVVIPNPKQDELTDLDDTGKHQGHVMNSIFVFRGKGRLGDPLCKCNTDDWL